MDVLAKVGERIAEVVKQVPGATDVRASNRSPGSGTCESCRDRMRLARFGLTVEDVNEATQTIAIGRGRVRCSRVSGVSGSS